MASSSINLRNRTTEFFLSIQHTVQSDLNHQQTTATTNSDNKDWNAKLFVYHSTIMKIAKAINYDIHILSFKINDLSKLAKVQSIFHDNSLLIEELTGEIRQFINNINMNILHLQQLQTNPSALASLEQQNQKEHHNSSILFEGKSNEEHLKCMLLYLQNKLAGESSKFKEALQQRTQTIKRERERKEHFSHRSSATNDVAYGERNENSPSGHSIDILQQLNATATADGNTDSAVANLTSLKEPDFVRHRGNAIQGIESTIDGLAVIFQQLSKMVTEQGESIQRIDANVDDFNINVKRAHNQLVRFYNSISSDRKLMLKLFLGLIFIVILWKLILGGGG